MGREFIDLFNDWSQSYDETVSGTNIEYKEVFRHYDKILNEVAKRVKGHIIEFGAGTGNLTKLLQEQQCEVIGIEPSPKMREIALKKVPNVQILDGDFLNFPIDKTIHAFVSSYAFHHLTNDEKNVAIKTYSDLLQSGGKVVFADTVFRDDAEKQRFIENAEREQFLNLAYDLKTEYYTTIDVLETIFLRHGFTVQFKQMNDFVWIIEAIKK
ncbi:class I SAM-dependent methyltransferase [Salirhabdus salicampi]|uniref:class I SAM-dependent methyltransferase n=1 Tax=Salirhabdus salicampi TaxID=476102 RepID=UPI0020C541FD|nr:class I SAM-dependent methyltransferase [Salirhabdus salicampi]MCP8616151.1 class I SAM-dependent methyltransferase [Salirhabdus salicampi]